MAYRRCDCNVGDIPHPTEAEHKRKHSRCTRVVAFEIRRVRDTNGRKATGPWYAFCEPCAKSIRAYQGSDIEMRPAAEADGYVAPENRQPILAGEPGMSRIADDTERR